MKRFCSWVVLLISNALVFWLTGLAADLMVRLFDEFSTLSLLQKALVIFLGFGEIMLGIVLASVFASAAITALCDKISKSRAGLRYRVVGIISLLLSGVNLLLCIVYFFMKLPGFGDAAIQNLMLVMYSIALFVHGKSLKNTYEEAKAASEQRRIEALVEAKLREKQANTNNSDYY